MPFPRPKGAICMHTNAFETIDSALINNPDIDGFSIGDKWKDLEPTQGNFVWTRLDALFDQLSGTGKIIITGLPTGGGKASLGGNAPDWAVNLAGSNVFTYYTNPEQTETQTIAAFWNEDWLDAKTAAIQAIAQRYYTNSQIKLIRTNFANGTTEDWSVPTGLVPDFGGISLNQQWLNLGWSHANMLYAAERIFGAAGTYWQNQIIIFAAGDIKQNLDAPYGQFDLARDAISAAKTAWGSDRIYPTRNSVSAFMQTAPPPGNSTLILHWENRPLIEGQNLGKCFDDPTYRMNQGVPEDPTIVLKNSVDRWKAYYENEEGGLLEIYEADCQNLPDAIAYAHDVLNPFPSPPPPPAPVPGPTTARIITFIDEQIGLLVAQPNWESEVKISLTLPTDIAKEPITFNESRRVFAGNARYSQEWVAYLPTSQQSTELRMFFTRVRGETIAAPLWTDGCELSAAIVVGTTNLPCIEPPVRYGTYWIIANDDFSTWEIVSVSAITGPAEGPVTIILLPGTIRAWPAGTIMYPLMFGRLTDRPQPEAITDETSDVTIKLKENSEFARRLSTRSSTLPVVGNHIPAFATTPLWSVPPNHVRPLDWTEMPDVVYQEIGFLREEQQRVYDHRNARGLELEFFQNTRGNLAKIEVFWRLQRGPVLRFMIPSWRGDMRMASNTPQEDPTQIVVEPTQFTDPTREPQPGDPFIALIANNNTIDPYELSTTVRDPGGVEYLKATQAVAAHTAALTIISHLLLARFAETTLEWSYITPYLATTRIKFQELPHEYADPPAALPEPAYLFIFTELGVRTDRFTSYENTIVVPSGTFTGTYVPAPFSFDSVITGLKLDQEKLEFKSFKFDGNPLNKMWPFALDGTLSLVVVEVNALNPQSATAVIRFSGDVWGIDSDYKATALAFGNFFERKFPRFLLSVSDNYTQFSVPTKLNEFNFKIDGVIFSQPTPQWVYVTSAPGFAKAANWFAGGWLVTGTGVNIEKRGILSSAPDGTNRVLLHIDRPLIKALDGQDIDMYPGYDGSIDQCFTKFDNRLNFGGHAYMPNVNPGVKAMKAQEVEGGKK